VTECLDSGSMHNVVTIRPVFNNDESLLFVPVLRD